MRLRYLTAGESHGSGITVIIDGLPSGIPVKAADIQFLLAQRRNAYGRSLRQNSETDTPSISGGIIEGRTTGAPVIVSIPNVSFRPDIFADTNPVKDFIPKPGHADLAGMMKFMHDNFNPVRERASARETAARTAAGAIAIAFLSELGITISGRTVSIGAAKDLSSVKLTAAQVNRLCTGPLRCADKQAAEKMKAVIDRAAEAGTTLGGVFEVRADNLPVGLGSCMQHDLKLSAILAGAICSINGVKGFEIGSGFSMAEEDGAIYALPYKSNISGGIEGGMTNGQPLILRAAVKPIPGRAAGNASFDIKTGRKKTSVSDRSDICAVPAASIIGMAETAMCLAGAIRDKFGGDSVAEIKPRLASWRKLCEKKLKRKTTSS